MEALVMGNSTPHAHRANAASRRGLSEALGLLRERIAIVDERTRTEILYELEQAPYRKRQCDLPLSMRGGKER
jgi:hypothetical protein